LYKTTFVRNREKRERERRKKRREREREKVGQNHTEHVASSFSQKHLVLSVL
jgi:hypothetical protein